MHYPPTLKLLRRTKLFIATGMLLSSFTVNLSAHINVCALYRPFRANTEKRFGLVD